MLRGEVWVGDGAEEVAAEAARRFGECARRAVGERGRFGVALAGGSTPRALYGRLAAGGGGAIAWDAIDFFFGDERCVPPDHADSNYRLAREALFEHVPVDPARVRRIDGARDPDDAARAYESALLAWWQAPGTPRLDLVLLGMGRDGHTASLFPGSAALAERTRLVVANHVTAPQPRRITFTVTAIDAARVVMPIICGADKAPVLSVVRGAPADAPVALVARHPILLLRPAGAMAWLLDRASAAIA